MVTSFDEKKSYHPVVMVTSFGEKNHPILFSPFPDYITLLETWARTIMYGLSVDIQW